MEDCLSLNGSRQAKPSLTISMRNGTSSRVKLHAELKYLTYLGPAQSCIKDLLSFILDIDIDTNRAVSHNRFNVNLPEDSGSASFRIGLRGTSYRGRVLCRSSQGGVCEDPVHRYWLVESNECNATSSLHIHKSRCTSA